MSYIYNIYIYICSNRGISWLSYALTPLTQDAGPVVPKSFSSAHREHIHTLAMAETSNTKETTASDNLHLFT